MTPEVGGDTDGTDKQSQVNRGKEETDPAMEQKTDQPDLPMEVHEVLDFAELRCGISLRGWKRDEGPDSEVSQEGEVN